MVHQRYLCFLWAHDFTNCFPSSCSVHYTSGLTMAIAPVLCFRSILIVGYLDYLLLKRQLTQSLSVNVQWTVQTLQTFRCILTHLKLASRLGLSEPDPRYCPVLGFLYPKQTLISSPMVRCYSLGANLPCIFA